LKEFRIGDNTSPGMADLGFFCGGLATQNWHIGLKAEDIRESKNASARSNYFSRDEPRTTSAVHCNLANIQPYFMHRIFESCGK